MPRTSKTFAAGDRGLCSLCLGGGHGMYISCALDCAERGTVGKPLCRSAEAWGARQGRNLILTLVTVPGSGEVSGDRYVDDPA